MKIKIAVLDDDATLTRIYERLASKFNSTKHIVELYVFNNVYDFLLGVDESFDIFMIDKELNSGEPNGVKIANDCLEHYPETVILMASGSFPEETGYSALLGKCGLNCRKIYKKYLRFKKAHLRKVLEIKGGQAEFEFA